MNQHISEFEVQNFKRFDTLKLSNLGQFNLIVGDNNIGKTSVLEALLWDEDIYKLVGSLYASLVYRKIKLTNVSAAVNLLFKNKEKPLVFVIGEKMYEITKKSISIEIQDVLNSVSDTNMSFIPFGLNYDDDLTRYFSNIIKKDYSAKQKIINTLKIFVPNLESIEPLEADFAPENLYLFAKLAGQNELLPFASLGDGANRLLRILLEIMYNKGKRLMIDEIDAGIHHSRMEIYWQTILQAAILYDVQLFMTTHSLECLQKFKNVAEMPDLVAHQKNMRMIKLRETADKTVKTTTFLYKNFAADLENENEVRGGTVAW